MPRWPPRRHPAHERDVRYRGAAQQYDECVKKRRITLNLDEDVVSTLEAIGGRSVSATANAALRDALASAAHRLALLSWLDELDEKHGSPSPAEIAAADRLLNEIERGQSTSGAA